MVVIGRGIMSMYAVIALVDSRKVPVDVAYKAPQPTHWQQDNFDMQLHS